MTVYSAWQSSMRTKQAICTLYMRVSISSSALQKGASFSTATPRRRYSTHRCSFDSCHGLILGTLSLIKQLCSSLSEPRMTCWRWLGLAQSGIQPSSELRQS